DDDHSPALHPHPAGRGGEDHEGPDGPGADFQRGGPIQRAPALMPILVPLFVSAFRRADDLALAMEARCYRGGEGRTRYRVLRFKRTDMAAWAVTVALFAVILWLGRQGVG